jgi:hypothetical protein
MVIDFITNEQRRYIGLEPIGADWDVVAYKNRQNIGEIVYLLFDGDTIRRLIRIDDCHYEEIQLHEQTAENRTLLLPKTKRGKPKSLNFAATQALRGIGCYFYVWCGGQDRKECTVGIANYTTQQTYISEAFQDTGNIQDVVQRWLQRWIADTTEKDLAELERFKNAKRMHQAYKSGDFFAYRLSRREWGFGRILMVVSELKKDPQFVANKNYGLIHLMGQALIVQIYHKIALSPTATLEELRNLPALPAQAIMDNEFYYGEHPIIGHLPVSPEEYDPLISLGRGLGIATCQTVYLQYGLIYKETTMDEFLKVFPGMDFERFRNEGIGFKLNIDYLRDCLAKQSNEPFWGNTYSTISDDLRNPRNAVMKHRLFAFFGLDAEKSYAENLSSYTAETQTKE